MIDLLINILIIVLVLGVAWWVCTLIPLPPPFLTIVQVIIVVIALILVIKLLLGVTGASWHGPLLR